MSLNLVELFQKSPKLLAKISAKYILPIHSCDRRFTVN